MESSPFPTVTLATARGVGDHCILRPRLSVVRGGARVNGAGVFTDRVRCASAIHADQLLSNGLNHRPGVVSAHILHDLRLGQSLQGCHLDHGQASGPGERVGGIFGLALNTHAKGCAGLQRVAGLQDDGPGVEGCGGKRGSHGAALNIGGVQVLLRILGVNGR